MKSQITALQDTCAHLFDAHKHYIDFIRLRKQVNLNDIEREILAIAGKVTRLCEEIVAERDRTNARIYGTGLLRVKIYGNDHERDVTIQRPDSISNKPYITEASYNAIAHSFGLRRLTSKAGFDIDIITNKGRKAGTIKSEI